MTESLDDLIKQAEDKFEAAPDEASLENEKAKFLGKNGAVTALLKGLASLPNEQKREQGQRINQVK